MTDEPSKIAAVMKIARKTIRIANQNIVFALGVKFLVLILGALGYANVWAAVFADVGVSIIAILNAGQAAGYACGQHKSGLSAIEMRRNFHTLRRISLLFSRA